jgi:hypothetical protein
MGYNCGPDIKVPGFFCALRKKVNQNNCIYLFFGGSSNNHAGRSGDKGP